MTAIPESTSRYIKRTLELNPVYRSSDIMDVRAKALRKPRLDQTADEANMADIATLRRNARNQISMIQSEFWKLHLEALKRHIEMIDVKRLPELAPVVGRLRTAAACRGEFPRLSQEPWMDRQLFDAFKSAVVLPPAEAALARERFLGRGHTKAELKQVKAAVTKLEAQYPVLYGLERDWFQTIKTAKPQRGLSEGEEFAPSYGSSFDFEGLGWIGGIGVIILIRVLLRLMTSN